jgi:hypothetical protein
MKMKLILGKKHPNDIEHIKLVLYIPLINIKMQLLYISKKKRRSFDEISRYFK